jgi:hypothetical protein
LADEDSDTPLDYSAPANGATSGEDEGKELPGAVVQVDQLSWGSKTGKGQFVLKDLDNQVNSILASADAKKVDSAATSTGLVGSSISAIGGLFRNVVGGKTLTKEDLDKAMKGMEDHLLRKNVAREAAIRLCEGVERELIGVKTGNFESQCGMKFYVVYQLTCSRCAGKDPDSDGVFITEDPYTYLISRSSSRNRCRYISICPFPAEAKTVCNVNSWCERCWQVYESFQDLFLFATKQVQGSCSSMRYLQIRSSGAIGGTCQQFETAHSSRRRSGRVVPKGVRQGCSQRREGCCDIRSTGRI